MNAVEKTKWEIAENIALRELILHVPFHQPKHCCWMWNRYRNAGGYGVIVFGGFHFTVHRLSFKHFKGLIPRNMLVMHDCDCPPCFNPNHLFLGSNLDNVRDAIRKGRRGINESADTENSWAWLNPPPSRIAQSPHRHEILEFIGGQPEKLTADEASQH